MARENYVRFRVSDDEKNRLKKKAAQADLSLSEYLRKVGLEKNVDPIVRPELNKKVWKKLRSALSNLNQLARAMNQNKDISFTFSVDDLQEIYDLVQKLREDLRK